MAHPVIVGKHTSPYAQSLIFWIIWSVISNSKSLSWNARRQSSSEARGEHVTEPLLHASKV